MTWGILNEDQEHVLRVLLDRKLKLTVHDLGCGDFALSKTLLRLGAHRVIGVDNDEEQASRGRLLSKKIRFELSSFDFYKDPIAFAFVSWPTNHRSGIKKLIERSPIVAYLGKNTDGMACGTPSLFEHLTTREVLAYSPDPRNSLIVYGARLVERPVLGEEMGGLTDRKIIPYNKAAAWDEEHAAEALRA